MKHSSSPISELIGRIFRALPDKGCSESPPALFHYVGRPAEPRWIFPASANVASVFGSWSPYSFLSKLAWRAIRYAQVGNVTSLLPGAGLATVHKLPMVDWSQMGWRHSADPIPVMYIGTRGPRQKAVMHLVNPSSGECDSVLKVPLRAAARESIIHESNVLSVLEDEFFACAPSLLFSDRTRCIARQRFLPGKPGRRQLLPEYVNLLRSLILRDEHTTLAGHAARWHDHPLWDSLNKPQMATLSAALAEQWHTTLLPACWAHGDFAPWNIRHSTDGEPRLIDWEMGQRAALPLHDAFHFLHMQQFLFRRRPESFVAAVKPLARSIGIGPSVSRQLELAYLARSYFCCIDDEEVRRAEFLLATLSLVLREGRRSTSSNASGRLRLVASRPERQIQARTEMLSAVTAQLEREDVAYCILSGYEKAAASAGSDVDMMFRPEDVDLVPPILARAARAVGAAVVQAIRHETSACYFVLARPEGKHVTHLAIDAYGNYQRDGRTWLSAAPLIARRRRYRDFFRLSTADEFVYRLTKKVLKQSLPGEQLKHLLHLFARDSAECHDAMARHWPLPMASEVERAVLQQNRAWVDENLPALRRCLLESRRMEGMLGRCKSGFFETARLVSRVLRPTGFLITIAGDSGLCADLADRLMCNFAPVFRRTEVLQPGAKLWRSIPGSLQTYAARIRSTLVIEVTGNDLRHGGAFRFRRADLELQLTSAATTAAGNGNVRSSETHIALDGDDPPDELARKATAAILRRLAHRAGRRLRLPPVCVPESHLPQRGGEAAVELEFVGSD